MTAARARAIGDDASTRRGAGGRSAAARPARPAGRSATRPAARRRRSPDALDRWRRDAVRRMTSSRRATLAFVARLPEGEMRSPRAIDRWSVKDMLGHLLACDDETVRRLDLIARGQGSRIQWFESMAHADRFNARSVARMRRLGLKVVLKRLADVRADLVGRFQRLDAEAFGDPTHAYPIREWLPAPGWSHEQDHLDEIRRWWTSRRPAGGRRPRA
jgi:DinB family protein